MSKAALQSKGTTQKETIKTITTVQRRNRENYAKRNNTGNNETIREKKGKNKTQQ